VRSLDVSYHSSVILVGPLTWRYTSYTLDDMEAGSNTKSNQKDSNSNASDGDYPPTPVPAQNPDGKFAENQHNAHESDEDIRAEADTISPTKPPVTLGPNDTPDHNSTLVDTVTDKIRGESMSLPADNPPQNHNTLHPEASMDHSHSGSDGDSSDKEHSRKRKLSSRSSVANEVAVRQHPKRPKESDVLEREEDPEEPSATSSTVAASTSKPGQVFGFGSFASTRSPFVSAQSSSHNLSPNTPAKSESGFNSSSTDASKASVSEKQKPEETAADSNPAGLKQSKQSGFAAFAATTHSRPQIVSQLSSGTTATSAQRESLAGPVRRSKSPVGKHQAFGQYSTGLSRFAAASSRKPSQDELAAQQPSADSQPPEFEDILKSKGEELENDRADKPSIQAIEHNTGEEDDLTVFQTRAKLYTQDESFAYKERGTGLLKLNVRRSDGEGARIVMRAEGVLRLLLNMPLYPGLICELGPDPKFIKVAEITTRERKLHAVKVGSAKVAQELYDHLMDNTPSKLSGLEQV